MKPALIEPIRNCEETAYEDVNFSLTFFSYESVIEEILFSMRKSAVLESLFMFYSCFTIVFAFAASMMILTRKSFPHQGSAVLH